MKQDPREAAKKILNRSETAKHKIILGEDILKKKTFFTGQLFTEVMTSCIYFCGVITLCPWQNLQEK